MEEIEAADTAGVKLDMTEGLPIPEFIAINRHQAISMSNSRSMRPRPEGTARACYRLADVVIQFPDGSIRRPDISVICAVPSELDEEIRAVPAATVEIVSLESRSKDYVINPPFSFKHGVLDVIVIDPIAKNVVWFTKQGRNELSMGQTWTLQSGCLLEV